MLSRSRSPVAPTLSRCWSPSLPKLSRSRFPDPKARLGRQVQVALAVPQEALQGLLARQAPQDHPVLRGLTAPFLARLETQAQPEPRVLLVPQARWGLPVLPELTAQFLVQQVRQAQSVLQAQLAPRGLTAQFQDQPARPARLV
jgi:hypothetical protein